MQSLRELVIITLVMIGLDAVWLLFVGGVWFRRWLGDLVRPRVNYPAVVVTYLVMVLGLWWFVDFATDSLWLVVRDSFLFGFAMYAVYESTNYATIKNWPRQMVLVDVLWGGALTAIAGAVAWWLS